jgi:type I restriction enzyme M protein
LLDSETKRRIDSARDILVGKVPDPKSQVEQITIALIYKFMDDMDKQSIEMGGKASFFKGEFKKYGWGNIFDPRLGGVEMLNLYGEAITRMSQNANLPELFRNIFKNAYLPYRDPETLKLFLKTINDFTYDHSEKLGDAFEYLLSVLGSQGDAGQFRTPRHIIDFMVQVVDPKKNETVLDPACGTAGFLISAYKYILKSNQEAGKPLTTQEKQKLYENFTGYDISPDMVRLSLVNLYLHGFVKPQIHEYDSLASEERWNEYADVILANPPFMSPKGGIMPHKKFSVQSNRSEVLFVDYMAEHLTPNGRAAIIVPEGIIFQSAGAYKQLRKYLIEHNFLWAVVSLPAGAFNPYSGVKTSILFLDKSLAKKTDKVLFVKVENDGYDLGAQRRPIDRNDLPETLKVLQNWRNVVASGAKQSPDNLGVASSLKNAPRNDMSLLVSISKLEENEYNLSADRYREVVRVGKQTYPTVALGEIATFYNGRAYKQEELLEDESKTPVLRVGNLFTNNSWYYSDLQLDENKYCSAGDLLYAWSASFGPFIWDGPKSIYHYHIWKVEHSDRVEKMFLYHMLQKVTETIRDETHGIAMLHMTKANMEKVQIPLPPLDIQRQLVDEIAAHQRIIDGARQVVEGWGPDIEIELVESLPEGVDQWETCKLGDVIELISGQHIDNEKYSLEYEGTPYITGPADFGEVHPIITKWTKEPKVIANKNDILITVKGSGVGKLNILDKEKVCISRQIMAVRPHKQDFMFIYYWLLSQEDYFHSKSSGAAIPGITRVDILETTIPLPPLEIQRGIVASIETERAIVHGNRELIRIYEEKVKKVIERVWEG